MRLTYTKPTPKPRVVKLSKTFQLSSQSQSLPHYDSANKMERHTRMLQSLQTLSSASSNVLSWRANQWHNSPSTPTLRTEQISTLEFSLEDLEFLQCTHHKLHAQKPLVPNGRLAFLLLPLIRMQGGKSKHHDVSPPHNPPNWHTLVASLPCTQLNKAVTSPVPTQVEILYYVFLSLSCMSMWCVCVCCTQLDEKVTWSVPS